MATPGRLTTADYLSGAEELRRQELIWGYVRSPPSPRYGHQSIVTRTVVLLDQHVRAHNLGGVCVSPIDVVLDARKALVVQPDVIYVSKANAGIIRAQVWGAPDLVVEVESLATRLRDRKVKFRWYRKYGVREYWLIDPRQRSITVVQLDGARVRRRLCQGEQPVRSEVLTSFDVTAAAFFA
ncbi:MAG: hypothetical protein A3J29_14950 [Acidobacteria bacterium RIFCSPLOWO2_12_FULL_67_14b]|nr:MAG: hypothetical protein A3J29_14950 [Acidobacteria bacterium RIFCSPLOWO2_12_FULL_67_14b]